MELYRKHRPKTFKAVIGQDAAVSVLKDYVRSKNIPHAILFAGPSGTGKTTLARIVKDKLGCSDDDFSEINAADFRGIDTVREIRMSMGLAPISGSSRVWLIDEAAQLTSQSQNALLKILEEPPDHCYFMLATTLPQKLLKTIRTRCTEINVKLLNDDSMEALVNKIARREDVELDEGVVDKIVECAQGSPRKALVLLESIIGMESADEQLNAIESADTEQQAIELARGLISGAKWPSIAKILSNLEEDVESLRWMVLSYARKVMLGGGKQMDRAFLVIDAFEEPFYNSGRAGLEAACFRIIFGND